MTLSVSRSSYRLYHHVGFMLLTCRAVLCGLSVASGCEKQRCVVNSLRNAELGVMACCGLKKAGPEREVPWQPDQCFIYVPYNYQVFETGNYASK